MRSLLPGVLCPPFVGQEFLVVRIDIPVYVTEVEVLQNLNPGILTRILARYPNGTGYYSLWYGPPVVYTGTHPVATSPLPAAAFLDF